MNNQFSPNMLKTFEQCPKKFYMKYVKHINMPVNDDIFEFGKNIHALASYYLKNENIDKMESVLTQKKTEVWKYLKSVKYFSFEVINTEYSLTVKVDKYYFGGRIDALVKVDDEYYILDYKTGSAPKNAKYDFQTMIYLLAVSKFFKTEKVNFIYLDLKNKTEVKIQLTNELVSEYEKKLIQIANKISIMEEPVKKPDCNSTDCSCEYKAICF